MKNIEFSRLDFTMDINFKNKSIGFTKKCEWKRTIAPQICVQNRVAPNQLYGLILLEDQSYSWYVSLKQMCDVVFRLAPVRSSAVSKPGSGHSSGGFSDANTWWGSREFPENYGADIWWFWCRYLEGFGSFRCRYLMRFWGVDEDGVRSSGKFLRRYAVGFRRVFVLIPGDVPEVSGEDATGLNFVVGFTFTQLTGHLISRCMAWCSLVSSCPTSWRELLPAWLPFLCRNSCSQRSSVQHWRVSHAFLVVINWVTVFSMRLSKKNTCIFFWNR